MGTPPVIGTDAPDPPLNPRHTGAPALRIWRTEEITGHPITREVVVHPETGYVFVSNTGGVLMFDGVRWRLIPLPEEKRARELAIDDAGRVWAAGTSEVVVLTPPDLEAGESPTALVAHHIADFFHPSDPDRGTASAPPKTPGFTIEPNSYPSVINTPQGMTVRMNQRVMLFGPAGLKQSWDLPGLVSPTDMTGRPWWSEGALYVFRDDHGVHRLESDRLSKLPIDQIPAVLSTTVRDGAETLWLTMEGPWRAHGNEAFPIASTATQALLREAIATRAIALPDGGSAFATYRRGLIILNAEGDLVEIIDTNRGLPTDRVNDVALDSEGGLWLATHVGIIRLQHDTPFALHGPDQGLRGRPRELSRVGDRLYLSHTEGLAWRDSRTGQFNRLPGVVGDIYGIDGVGDSLLISADRLFSVGPSDSRALSNAKPNSKLEQFKAVAASRSIPGAAYINDGETNWLVQPNPASAPTPWSPVIKFEQSTGRASAYFDNGAGEVWIAPRSSEVFHRLDLRDGVHANAPVNAFGQAAGLPAMETTHRVGLFDTGDRFWATSRLGTWQWDDTKSQFRPEPQLMAAGVGPEAVGSAEGYGWMYFHVPEPHFRKVEIDPSGAIKVTDYPVPELAGIDVKDLYVDTALQTIWVNCQVELLSFDPSRLSHATSPSWSARIARVTTTEGATTLWDPSPYAPAPAAINLTLETNQRAVRIEFAAPSSFTNIQSRSPLRFRSRIEPLEHDWTPWSEETYRDLSNLPDGEITLTVEARNIVTSTTSSHTLALNVLPPWWRTNVAYGLWVLLGLGAMFGLVRARTRVLQRRNDELESVVNERTAELSRLRQIDRDESASAKLAEEKTRLEMLRYQLNPHFLYNALNSIRALTHSRPPAAGEMVQQLADLCRVTLTRNEDFAPVSEELAMLRLYLDMEKTRWRDKLQITIQTAPDANACEIPPFLLLPLVENALKHGRRDASGVMNLRIETKLETEVDSDHSTLVFQIANTGTWLSSSASLAPSTGIGLENLRQRLKRYYPDAHELRTEQVDDQVIVTIRLSPFTPDSSPADSA
ncbi:MAG: hypothetical protein SynsKO_08820 [Synoicihabitans sp.]